MNFWKYGFALIVCGIVLVSCDKDEKGPDLAASIQGDYQVYAYKLDQDSVNLPTPPTSSILSGTTSYSVTSTLNFTRVSNSQSTMNLQFQAVKKSVVNGVTFTTTTNSNQNGTVNLTSGSGGKVVIEDVSGSQLGSGNSQAVMLTMTAIPDNKPLRIYARK